MENGITRQSDSLDLQDKEGVDKINYRALSYRPVIKSEFQTTIAIGRRLTSIREGRWNSSKNKLKALEQECSTSQA